MRNDPVGAPVSEPAAAPVAGAHDFRWYLASTSGWMAGFQLQTFLITWLLVGTLQTSPDWVGFGQLLIGLPGLLLILFGGARADQVDARTLIVVIQAALVVPPLLLLGAAETGLLDYALVVGYGMVIAGAVAYSDPARAALLNRLSSGSHIQRLVGASTIVTTFAGLAGFMIGGQLESLSLAGVLLLQAALFGIAGIAMTRVTPAPIAPPAVRVSTFAQLGQGFGIVASHPVLRSVILINFLSGLVNAGAYAVALPFITTGVYAGDASLFAWLLMTFYFGSIVSNSIFLRFAPIPRPGQLFLLMQLSRLLILGLIWWLPPLPVFFAAAFLWGMNMGITTTLVRSVVQEVAPAAHRGKVLSVLLIGFSASMPIGSMLLGQVIDAFGAPAGLVPGMVVSGATFLLGIALTPLWQWRSDAAAGSHGVGASD